MVDLFGADKGNISLPPRLQSPEVHDGKTDDLKQVMILNMQKAVYQVRINDIAQRIQRLQSRNTEVEELCELERLRRSQIDIDTANEIVQLNKQISSEKEKITDYQKRIQVVTKWMDDEKQAHFERVEAANKKYNETRLAIVSEIKVLNAKINTLEEYKASKTDLKNKLIAGNNLIAQREEEAKQRCEQIQRKFKISREKLKKEMYARLQELAGTFQTEVAASSAKPIHRLMRENIFVKNELENIVIESEPKKEKMKEEKEADGQIIREIVSTKNETVQQLIQSKIQGYLLAAVKEQHGRVKDCAEKLEQSDIETKMKSTEVNYCLAKIQANKAFQYISRLEKVLHRQQTQLGLVNYLRDKSKIEVRRCTDILYDAKYAVSCALAINDTGKDLLEMGDRKLMVYLMDILRKGDTERWKNRTHSLASIPPPETAYKIGNLGFQTSRIELSDSRRITMENKLSRLSTLKILDSLRIRLSRVNSIRGQIKPWEMDIVDLTEEYKDLIDEKGNEIGIGESSPSLDSIETEEEQEQKLGQSEAVEEEERETDTEMEAEVKIEEKDTAKQEELDKGESTTNRNEINDESAEIVIENKEEGPEEDDVGV